VEKIEYGLVDNQSCAIAVRGQPFNHGLSPFDGTIM
jgi:hypothetical protein